MKIVVLEGSPNKHGSSNLLADEFIRGAQEAGHTVRVNAFIALIDMVGFRFAGYGRGRVKPCLHTQSCFQ